MILELQLEGNCHSLDPKTFKRKKSGTLVPDLVPNNRKALINSSCL